MPAKTDHDSNTKNLSRLVSPLQTPEGWNTPRIASEQSDVGKAQRGEQREGEHENAVFFGRSMRTLRGEQ